MREDNCFIILMYGDQSTTRMTSFFLLILFALHRAKKSFESLANHSLHPYIGETPETDDERWFSSAPELIRMPESTYNRTRAVPKKWRQFEKINLLNQSYFKNWTGFDDDVSIAEAKTNDIWGIIASIINGLGDSPGEERTNLKNGTKMNARERIKKIFI